MVVTNEATGAALARVTGSAAVGELVDALGSGPLAVWDHANVLTLKLYAGHLASADDGAALAGSNRLAVETDTGAWEIVAFAMTELVSPGTYRLTRLLRGLGGSSDAVGSAAAGNRVIVLDDRVVTAPVSAEWLGDAIALKAYAGPLDVSGVEISFAPGIGASLPLSPVHLQAIRDAATTSIAFTWMRRSRADNEAWATSDAPLEVSPEAYRLTIFNGASAVRSIESAMPAASYPAAAQIADFGSLPASFTFTFTVAQLSPVFGPGASGQGAFNA